MGAGFSWGVGFTVAAIIVLAVARVVFHLHF